MQCSRLELRLLVSYGEGLHSVCLLHSRGRGLWPLPFQSHMSLGSTYISRDQGCKYPGEGTDRIRFS